MLGSRKRNKTDCPRPNITESSMEENKKEGVMVLLVQIEKSLTVIGLPFSRRRQPRLPDLRNNWLHQIQTGLLSAY